MKLLRSRWVIAGALLAFNGCITSQQLTGFGASEAARLLSSLAGFVTDTLLRGAAGG